MKAPISIRSFTRSGLDSATKGDVISFDWDGATEIKNIVMIDEATNTAALMFTNGEQVRLDNNGYDLADDVVIINIDSKNAAGVGGNAITTAAQTATSGVYYDNCWYHENADHEIDLLVIDVTEGKLSGAGTGWNTNAGGSQVPDISIYE